MNIRYLHEFLVLAETNNFQEAAYKLFISQSTLSKHIQFMEKELKVSLFDRSTRKVKLSKYGQILLPYAYKITQLQKEYISDINCENNKKKNQVTIVSTPQMYQYSIAEILTQYKHKHPSTYFDIVIQPNKNFKNLIRQQEANFVFLGEPRNKAIEDDFERIPFLTEKLFVMLPKNHPLSDSTTIYINKLRDEQFIVQDQGSIEYEVFLDMCKVYGFKPNIITVPLGNTLVDFVRKGIGIAILLGVPAQNISCTNVCLKEIKSDTIIDINLLYLKDIKLSPAAKDFLEYVKSIYNNETTIVNQ